MTIGFNSNTPSALSTNLLCGALLLLCSTGAKTSEFQESYPVSGSTFKEVLAQIGLNSESPEGAFGYTKLKTHVGWTATVDAEGVCTIDTVDFTYDITIHMPEWLDKLSAKQCLQDSWDEAWNEVQLHEEHHRDLYRLIDAYAVEQRISAIQPQQSCAALEDAVNREVEMTLEANNKLHDYFHARNSPATLWDC